MGADKPVAFLSDNLMLLLTQNGYPDGLFEFAY